MWQPIETAPKNGTPLLLANGVAITTGQWSPLSERWCDIWFMQNLKPTHWMPLPPPPTTTSST